VAAQWNERERECGMAEQELRHIPVMLGEAVEDSP
jgi:hypothetical protein